MIENIQKLKQQAYDMATSSNFISSVRAEAMKAYALLVIAENQTNEKHKEATK